MTHSTGTIGRPVRELDNPTVDDFRATLYPAAQPVVMRGVAADWDLVRAAGDSIDAVADYLRRWNRASEVDLITAPPSVKGRFFYSDDDQGGLNFTRNRTPLDRVLDTLASRANGNDNGASAQYVEATPVDRILPGLQDGNRLAHAPSSVEPRIWIGNETTVQTHFDLAQNIAVVASGRRRFTLFPPQQTPNLYMGPIEVTPAGTPVSMVRLDAVDHDRFPRFAQAQPHALVADLEPGDAIFIPYMWWHHVQSFGDLNVLMNYWWNEYDDLGSPMHTMLHALMTIRDLPLEMRRAWQAMFDHFVFGDGEHAMDHMPAPMRGGLGPISPDMRPGLWRGVAAGIAPHLSPPPGSKPS